MVVNTETAPGPGFISYLTLMPEMLLPKRPYDKRKKSLQELLNDRVTTP